MIRVFSYGGGVQSTAALVLAAQKKVDFSTFLFCNVGEDSENPATLDYVREHARPFALAHGIEFVELQKTRFGEPETLYQRLTRPGSRSIGIPVRMAGSGAPGNRACTSDFKIKVIAKWLREHGVTPASPAICGLGISLDEFQRMRNDSGIAYEKLEYPLIDLRLDRAACTEIIRRSGLPIPPKSSCWFCPFHSLQVWQQMRQNQPDLFHKACELEQVIIDRMNTIKPGDAAYFTRKLRPLAQVTTELYQDSLFDVFDEESDACESGYCMA